MKFRALLMCTAAAALLVVHPAWSDDSKTSSNSFLDALTSGTPTLDTRYRYEDVHQNGLAHDEAQAHTVRTRLGYETGVFDNVKAKVQVENLLPLNGDTSYNNGVNGLTTYPTIADPRQMINLYEANLTWQGLPQSAFTVGRQTMVLDNERWIGAADWRQLGQTFDAVSAQNHSVQNLDMSYAYIFHVNRVFGPSAGSAAATPYDTAAHVFHAAYAVVPDVKLIGYGYLLDLRNAPTLSSQTYGMRVEAKHKLTENVNALLNGEYARQVNYANNPVSFGYNYFTVEPGIGVGPVTGKVAYESMGGDGHHALQTPLDTGHAFNGWAEKFLTTPVGGLDNVHAMIEYKSPSHNDWLDSTVVKAAWYDFNSNANSQHYGNEYDVWVGQTFYKHYTLGLQYAQFMTDNTAYTDTRKIVAQLQIKY